MHSLTILYPNGDDVRFDFDYYKNHHLPLVMSLFGSLIKKFELRKGVRTPDGGKPPHIAVVNIWFEDEAAFMEADAKHRPTLVPDVPNYTNVMPTIQQDSIFAVTTT